MLITNTYIRGGPLSSAFTCYKYTIMHTLPHMHVIHTFALRSPAQCWSASLTDWLCDKCENLRSSTTSHSFTNWYCWRRSDSLMTFSIGSSTFTSGCAAMYLWTAFNKHTQVFVRVCHELGHTHTRLFKNTFGDSWREISLCKLHALPDTQPTVLKLWRQFWIFNNHTLTALQSNSMSSTFVSKLRSHCNN